MKLTSEERRAKNRSQYLKHRDKILAQSRSEEAKEKRRIAYRKRMENPETRAAQRSKNSEWCRENKLRRKEKRLLDPDCLRKERERVSKRRERIRQQTKAPHRRARISARRKERYRSDPIYALTVSVRAIMGAALRREKVVRRTKSNSLIGCTWSELKSHIENQFLPGMTWDNRGPVWHVDHIIPFGAVNLLDSNQLKAVCHYTNLRPLWAMDNLDKRDRITDEVRQRMNELLSQSE